MFDHLLPPEGDPFDGDPGEPAVDWCIHCCSHHSPEAPCEDDNDWNYDDGIDLGMIEPSDGWYLDLIARASYPGFDPHSGWRD